MKNKKIQIIRKKLDKLDNIFLSLIKKRTNLVNQVLANKKYKREIVDKKRIKVILKNIHKKSKLKKIDPKITNSIWKSMIRAFIQYEYRNFKKNNVICYEAVIFFNKKFVFSSIRIVFL